jgi:hypothetical protein
VLLSSFVSSIPPMLHTHMSFGYHWRYKSWQVTAPLNKILPFNMGKENQQALPKNAYFLWHMFYVQHLKKRGTLPWNRSVNKQESFNISSAE